MSKKELSEQEAPEFSAATEQKTAEPSVDEQKPKMAIVELPLTRTETEPVYVALNGKSYLIQRGVKVEVPVGVAKILKHRDKMLVESLAFENSFKN